MAKKSRLLKYLEQSGLDENTNKIRLMEVGLIEKNNDNVILIKEAIKKHNMDDSIIDEFNNLNKELKKVYRGKFTFGLIYEEEKRTLDDIKINERGKIKVKKTFKEFCNKFNEEIKKIEESPN